MTKVAPLTKKKPIMKRAGRFIFSVAACMSLVYLGGVGRAQASCSNATAKGTYAFTCSGTNGGMSVAEVGQLILDGKGNVSGSVTAMVGGSLVYGPFGPIVGTYSVDPDCTASTEFTTPSPTSHFDFSLFKKGFFSLQTDSGAEVTCEKKAL
jgi:hypothetical protein